MALPKYGTPPQRAAHLILSVLFRAFLSVRPHPLRSSDTLSRRLRPRGFSLGKIFTCDGRSMRLKSASSVPATVRREIMCPFRTHDVRQLGSPPDSTTTGGQELLRVRRGLRGLARFETNDSRAGFRTDARGIPRAGRIPSCPPLASSTLTYSFRIRQSTRRGGEGV